MPGVRQWVGTMLLRSPAPLRSLRGVPILGNFIHRLSHRVLPSDEKVWAQVRKGPLEGIWLELNPRTGQSYLLGDAESIGQEILSQRLRPGMVFYDLGANIGLYSLLASRIVGPTGRVYSFEPDSEVAARLRSNIARNRFTNVTITEAGVWSSSGNQTFQAAGPSSPDKGTGTFVSDGRTAVGASVRCVALDDFIAGAPLPDAIKCDVEGAEVEALHGARKLLETSRPWIFCEIHSEENSCAVCKVLSGLGYTFETVDANHILASPPPPR
jgi:FkbM family methyltransferase